MVAIAFRFPAGRYHATPWGRHVNEADVEWPPSPWRILRALLAAYHRKIEPHETEPRAIEGLLETLGGVLPRYRLPPAVRAHSRHYMPQGRLSGTREDTALIFDAFARIDPSDELVVSWPVAPDEAQGALLADLVRELGFLGRAESWVEARILTDWQGEPNCYPSTVSVDTATGEALEPVRLIAPAPPGDYTGWRKGIVEAHGLDAPKLKKPQRLLLATLPTQWAHTLYNDTADLQAAGWSAPPGAQFVTYQRPLEAFTARPARKRPRMAASATTVRLALTGKPLPRIEDALRIGELVRRAAISKAERLGKSPVPAALSGHGLPAGNRHGHAFYLPEDADHDGHIDHVLVHAPDGLNPAAVHVLDRITRLWQHGGGDWQVILEGYGGAEDFVGTSYVGGARAWRSVTPYLHPWHAKKRFGVAQQIARECRERGLPEPEVEVLSPPQTGADGRRRRPVHFHRFRSARKRVTQPDTGGQFVTLVFPEAQLGPLALGFGCHFGLGIFEPRITLPREQGTALSAG